MAVTAAGWDKPKYDGQASYDEIYGVRYSGQGGSVRQVLGLPGLMAGSVPDMHLSIRSSVRSVDLGKGIEYL